MRARSARPSSCRRPPSSTAIDFDGNGHVDLRRNVPDVLASTANLLKVNGWRVGAVGDGTANFEVMREWNRSVVYRKTIVYFAEPLGGS
jgi:membrane-bound lytic murein transglycosylase B